MPAERKNILIVVIAGIGDLILASKSIRALRNGHPDARMNLLTTTEAADLARYCPYLDKVWNFPARELRKDKKEIFRLPKLIQKLRKTDFHLVVNLYRAVSVVGALKMGVLFSALGGAQKVGHDHKGFGFFLDAKAPAGTFQNRHVVDAMVEIAELAGGMPDQEGIDIFWDGSREKEWDHLFRDKKGPVIGINPGSDIPSKRWRPENYARVADGLAGQFDGQIILLGGPGEEGIAGEIRKNMTREAINLAGKVTLNDLVGIINRLDLLVTNDSGPMHIGAATRTPLVAVFGPEDPKLFGPYASPDLFRVLYKEVACRPCAMKRCNNPICLDSIAPEEVLESCIQLLRSRKEVS